MTNPVREVRPLSPSDWRVLQATRLRALRDSPTAFASTHTREAAFGEHQWRRWFDGATWLVAVDAGTIVGLAGLVAGAADAAPHVESIWVAPTHRRRGVLRSLIERLVEIGRTARADSLFLWVMRGNDDAQRAYTRLGFVPTGEEQRIRPGSDRFERRLRLDVRP